MIANLTIPTDLEIQQALGRVREVLKVTPLTHGSTLSELCGHELFLKWDNRLRTGSFKERGAVNFLASLSAEERQRGVSAGSAGNHALAVAYHASRLQIPAHIVMPQTAPLVKVQAVRALGAEVILHGTIFDDAYHKAIALSEEHGYRFVPGFNHPLIVAGQATCGLEILDQLPSLDSVIVPVGGGGLISGIALAIKHRAPHVQIIGVQSEWIIAARNEVPNAQNSSIPLALRPISIADGIAVKGIGELNAQIISSHVDLLVSVSEPQIAHAIMRLLELERTVVEGAGAAALAAALAGKLPSSCKKTAVLVCGSNIDLNVLSRLIERDMAQQQRLLSISVSVPDRPGSLHATTGLIAEQRANVLHVTHDRSFSSIPGNVTISFLLEVRDGEHQNAVLAALRSAGLEVVAER